MSAEKVELRTERLLLRVFTLEDVDDVLDYGSDPEWARFNPRPYTRRDAEDVVAGAVLTAWDKKPMFAVELDGRVVGYVELEVNPIRTVAELGYDIARSHWGKGLAAEAARAVVDWGFRELGLAKVAAFANIRNRQSWRVMEKLGMTREGVFRGGWRHRGQLSDSVAYGVLREDWQSVGGPLPPAPAPTPPEEKAAADARPEERRTARLLLRPFGPGDVDDVFEYAKDPEWAGYLVPAVPQPYTRRNAEEFIARQMRASAEKEDTWAIVLEGTVVGGVGISIDSRHETGELHYALARGQWGRGLMTEAAGAVVDWSFAERGLEKVWAGADTRNLRSTRVLEKLGMTCEGVRRGREKDVVFYGLLREEWKPVTGDRSGLDGEGSDHA